MVHAAEAVLLGDAVGEVDAPVGTETVEQAVGPGAVAVEDEVLAEEPDGLGRALVELGGSGDGMPVAAHELAHRRPWPHLGQCFVFLCGEHDGRLSPCWIGSDCSIGGGVLRPLGTRMIPDGAGRALVR